jgi:hypothetical protein
MPSSRIVACDQDITRINSTAPESEGIRMRKVEAAAHGFDLGQGDVSVLENCRLPHLLVGQHGASQAWPLPQKPIALALLSTFPRNGVPNPNEDEFYEVVYDEDAGHFVMGRRADAHRWSCRRHRRNGRCGNRFSTSKLKTANSTT